MDSSKEYKKQLNEIVEKTESKFGCNFEDMLCHKFGKVHTMKVKDNNNFSCVDSEFERVCLLDFFDYERNFIWKNKK